MYYYAVASGREVGIYNTWKECSDMVKGYKNSIYKKFTNKDDAIEFIEKNSEKDCIEIDYCIYTDGACRNNGNQKSEAGIGIYFGENDKRNVSEKVSGDKQTNNVAELLAINRAFQMIEEDLKNGKKIILYSDSIYAINNMRFYAESFEIINWKKEIMNKELIRNTYELYKKYIGKNIFFKYIKAHTNKNDIHSIGNYNADKLANIAIDLK